MSYKAQVWLETLLISFFSDGISFLFSIIIHPNFSFHSHFYIFDGGTFKYKSYQHSWYRKGDNSECTEECKYITTIRCFRSSP